MVERGPRPLEALAPLYGVSGNFSSDPTALTKVDAGVTKSDGSPTDDFGEPSPPKGIFSEMLA